MKIVPSHSAVALLGMALLAGTASPAEAQEGLELGFRGGLSMSSASVDFAQTLDKKSSRTGVAGGVFLSYHAGLVGLQVAAQYTQKGVDLEANNVLSQFDLRYAEFPAVVKLGIPLGVLKPSVFGGAGLGFNVGCDVGGEDCSGDFTSTEWTGLAGADLALYLGTISLWADGRYHVGLNDITDGSDLVTALKTRGWTFQLGVAVLIEYFTGV